MKFLAVLAVLVPAVNECSNPGSEPACEFTVNDDGTWTPSGWNPTDGFPPDGCELTPPDGIRMFEDGTWKIDDGTWFD